jgi:uncharacterized protein YqeY
MTNEAVAKGKGPDGVLSEDEVLTVIMRAAKQRKDSIQQFTAAAAPSLPRAKRPSLQYSRPCSRADVARGDCRRRQAKAAELGITDKTKANQLMGMLMKDFKGKADGTVVKEVVDSLF